MVRVSEGNSHTREEARQELGQTMRWRCEVNAALKCPSFGYAINRRTVGIVTNGRWKVLHAFDATIWSKPSGASAIDSCPTAR
jgi:hypothetical protein